MKHLTDQPDDVQSIGSLADPLRRRLYDAVCAASGPLTREQAAQTVGVAVHTAKHHLDKLVTDGLLTTEFRRLTGRTGPGSGRPAKLYRRTERELAVSLPARSYDLLSHILVNAIADSTSQGRPIAEAAADRAHDEGERLGRAAPSTSRSGMEQVGDVLAASGFEPHVTSDGSLQLHNCPFHKAASEQTELVCGLNLDFVQGVCEGLGATDVHPVLDPQPGMCCVRISPGSN